MENMRRELTVASVSWINETPNPISLAAEATLYDPEWVPKTYLGLVATANGDPGDNIADLPGFQKSKNFRAMTYCRIAFEESPSGISAFQVIDAFHDPGFTPPFKMRNWPSTLLSFDRSVYSFAWYAGEASPLSKVYTQSRHANTTLPALGAGEIVGLDCAVPFDAETLRAVRAAFLAYRPGSPVVASVTRARRTHSGHARDPGFTTDPSLDHTRVQPPG